jgi:excisionase family DNA binding protein
VPWQAGPVSVAQLHTPAEAAELLKVPESWLRKKAAARVIPCTFLGKHLRFSDDDISSIVQAGAKRPSAAADTRMRSGPTTVTQRGGQPQ